MFAWRDQYVSYNGSGTTGDPYWSSVSLLENFEVPVSTVVDTSSNNLTGVTTGLARYSNRSPFSAGNGGSIKMDNSTASQIQFPANTGFNFASNNFTVECWAYFPSFTANNSELVAVATNSATTGQASTRLTVQPNGSIYFLTNNSTASGWNNTSTTVAGTIALNTWYHIAGVRNGSNFTLYVNGVSKLTYTYSGVVGYLTSNNTLIGNLPVGTGFTGFSNPFITNVRIVNGTAVYTSAFTPPTTPLTNITNTQLLLTFTSLGSPNISSFDDMSNNCNLVTLGTGTPTLNGFSPYTNSKPGSIKFTRASSQFIYYPTITPYTFGTGNFTIEGYFYFNSINITQYLIDMRNSGVANAVIPTLYINSGNGITYLVNGVTLINTTSTVTTNTWYHIALCKSGTTTKLFLNGVTQNTISELNSYVSSRLVIGSEADSFTNFLDGYSTDIRISNTALYTSDFTPPNQPLTPNANTVFLLNGYNNSFNDLSINNQSIVNNVWAGSLSTVGGNLVAAAATLQSNKSKFGTQSMYLQAGGYQQVVDSTSLQFGTGNFTIECWIYITLNNQVQAIMSKGAIATGYVLQITSSNTLTWTSTSTVLKTSTTTISLNTWTFITIVRSGTTGYMFINGNQEGTTFSDTTNYNQTQNLFIGVDRGTTNGLNGYLDDIRITKGVARYTGSFSVPTSSFPTS